MCIRDSYIIAASLAEHKNIYYYFSPTKQSARTQTERDQLDTRGRIGLGSRWRVLKNIKFATSQNLCFKLASVEKTKVSLVIYYECILQKEERAFETIASCRLSYAT